MKTLAVHQLQREQSLYAVAGPGGTCPNSHPLSTCSKRRSPCKVYFFSFPRKPPLSLSIPFSPSLIVCLLAFRCTLAFVCLGFVFSLAPWQIQLSDNTIVWGPWVMASGVAGQQNGQPAIQTGNQTDVWDIWVTILLATNWTGTALSPQLCVLSSLGRHTQTSH